MGACQRHWKLVSSASFCKLNVLSGGDRGWDGWMASLIQWTWTWSKLWKMVKDREAWCATVHEVSKSRTWLGDWTTTKMGHNSMKPKYWKTISLLHNPASKHSGNIGNIPFTLGGFVLGIFNVFCFVGGDSTFVFKSSLGVRTGYSTLERTFQGLVGHSLKDSVGRVLWLSWAGCK